MAAATSTE